MPQKDSLPEEEEHKLKDLDRSCRKGGWLLHGETRSEEVRGVGNLTRAAYAKSAYDAQYETSPKLKSKRNTMIALRGAIHVACFHHSGLLKGVWRCLVLNVSV